MNECSFYLHTDNEQFIKCCSTIKWNKLLAQTMWLNLKNIKVSEKDKKRKQYIL